MRRLVLCLTSYISVAVMLACGQTNSMRIANKEEFPQYLYSEKEVEKVEAYIKQQYGEFEEVFHEIVSLDIHCDIAMIPPTDERPYYTLVTMGAGAYRMDIPKELKKWKLERAEYVIFLPKDWNIKSDKEEDYWPVRMLKDIARFPIYTGSLITLGHTVTMNEDSSPVASNTELNSCVLLNSFGKDKQIGEALKLRLFGDEVNFWQVLPLYQEEVEFTFEHSTNELIELLKDVPMVVDINRKNYCK